MRLQKSALILVDLQQDFCLGGRLAVPGGDDVIAIANQLQKDFDIIIATKDWHPADHESFASNHEDKAIGDVVSLHGVSQVLWPDHCIQGSAGAEFHPLLNTSRITKVQHKGTHKNVDSYSAFFDNQHLFATGLSDYLITQGVKAVYVMGLATDYCVKYTCLDAVDLGFDTYLIVDGCRGIASKSAMVKILDDLTPKVNIIHSTALSRLCISA